MLNNSLPNCFQTGVADSFFQSCGLGLNRQGMLPGKCDWADWLHRIKGNPDYDKLFVNYLQNPDLLIEKLKETGVKYYRFSLERSVLEPEEGKFSGEAIKQYRDFIVLLVKENIQPMVTLHHFVNPAWFTSQGGFEHDENIRGFVRYCEQMFNAFGDLVTYWMPINEPCILSFQRLRGMYPPGKISFSQYGQLIINLIKAHCQVYDAGKKINPRFHIGLCHNFLRMIPYTTYNPLANMVCHYTTEITHSAFLRFFQTGHYSLHIPLLAKVNYHLEEAPEKFDFVGVQYYLRPLIKVGLFGAKSAQYPGKKWSKLGSRFDPEGLEWALQEAATLNKPIWITETGSDPNPIDFFKVAIPIMDRSIKNGIPLKGALIWTMRDNLEWDLGDSVKLGLYNSRFQPKPILTELIRPLFQRLKNHAE